MTAWFCLAACGLLAAQANAAAVRGTVFLDRNGNGRRDGGEKGIAGVLVSDGRTVTVSGDGGVWRLESAEPEPLVWISTPRDHRPAGPFFRRAGGQGETGFPLVKAPQSDHFYFIQMTDTHVGRGDLVRQFCGLVNGFPEPPAFVINTGDLGSGLDTALPGPARFDGYAASTASLRRPLYHLPGNHDNVGMNNPKALRGHPDFGKGLYRRTFGPTYYSWDWGRVHFVALDASRIPYQEALGEEQMAWLAQDLDRQPAGKPVVIFCHQSLPALRDREVLVRVLAGRRVLAAFCGHLHRNEIHRMAGFTVYHTGALSGSWWSGPNVDGAPQGFRVGAIAATALSTAYFGREGPWPAAISRPVLGEAQSGVAPVAVSVLDFGRTVKVNAAFASRPLRMERARPGRWWSEWHGSLDSAAVPDGRAEVAVTVRREGREAAASTQFIAMNGKNLPPAVQAPGLIRMQISGVDAPHPVELNGTPLGLLPAGLADRTWVEYPVPASVLRRLNTLTIRVRDRQPGLKDEFNVGLISLKAGGAASHDGCRFFEAWRYDLGPRKEELTIRLCLP